MMTGGSPTWLRKPPHHILLYRKYSPSLWDLWDKQSPALNSTIFFWNSAQKKPWYPTETLHHHGFFVKIRYSVPQLSDEVKTKTRLDHQYLDISGIWGTINLDFPKRWFPESCWATPSHHPFEWDFPQQKPSSYWGTAILGNPINHH